MHTSALYLIPVRHTMICAILQPSVEQNLHETLMHTA